MLRVLLVCSALGLMLAGQSSAQTTFTFSETATGGTLGAESGDFGSVTLQLVNSGTGVPPGCAADACIEVTLNGTATSNLYNQAGPEPTVGLFAFNAPTGTNLVSSASCSTCSLNSVVGYDGLGTYSYTLSASGSSGTITGNTLTFYLQDPTTPFTSLGAIENPPTGTSSPNPVSDFGLDICIANGSGCATFTSGPYQNDIEHGYAAITPEPASCLLFGTGLLSLGAILRRKRGDSLSV